MMMMMMMIMIIIIIIIDHLPSGVVYNFGRVCLSVCQMITFESLDVGSSFSVIRCISMGIRVKSVYKGHRVKVKFTEAKTNVENLYSRNVKLRSAISPLL